MSAETERCWLCGDRIYAPILLPMDDPRKRPCPRCVYGIERDEYHCVLSVSRNARGTLRRHGNGLTVMIHDANPEAVYFIDWSRSDEDLVREIHDWLDAVAAYTAPADALAVPK